MTRSTPFPHLCLPPAALGLLLPALSAQGEQPPGRPERGLRLVYRVHLEAARKAGTVPAEAHPARVLARHADLLERRLAAAGHPRADAVPLGGDRILLRLPDAGKRALPEIEDLTERMGRLEWVLVVDRSQEEFDLEAERRRLLAWLDKPANRAVLGPDPLAIRRFNDLPGEQGGPLSRFVQWVPMHPAADPPGDLAVSRTIAWTDAEGRRRERTSRHLPLNRMKTKKIMAFTGGDLLPESIKLYRNPAGRVALVFELRPERRDDFGRVTGANKGRPFAILLDGFCRCAPVIQDRLPGRGIITLGSRTKKEEMAALVRILRHRLPYRARLELVEIGTCDPAGKPGRED